MNSSFSALMGALIGWPGSGPGVAGVEVFGLFDPMASGSVSLARSMTSAFLICLSGEPTALSDQAEAFLKQHQASGDPAGRLAAFFLKGIQLVREELDAAQSADPENVQILDRGAERLVRATTLEEKQAAVWEVFFPEALEAIPGSDLALNRLRDCRKISRIRPAADRISDPGAEVLLTSNALLTVPLAGEDSAATHVPAELAQDLARVMASSQRYWYDHPIPLGIAPEQNEVLYGLRGLARALAFERKRRPDQTGPLTVALSVSVTHDGLHELGREYLSRLLRTCPLEGLRVFLFTENETDRMKREVLFPAAARYFPDADPSSLDLVLGVDGEYGRHYSFLKAVAAWWHVLVDPKIRATFKIDLDQIFPQAELVAQTGQSAFEHLCSPLWGATGLDQAGREVELGLLAGALVNRKDIARGLFTPDVTWPPMPPVADQSVFFSALPQALSTEAEMMARYGTPDLDGRSTGLQRIHVTGGTVGALVSSLLRHRPFTPTFIGRAEDQAFLMSVLLGPEPLLRYAHASGLIMRHDKADLIPEAIESARLGKMVGDYLRILWFSHYARVLPGGLNKIKAELDPFTGGFISRWPKTVVLLRLALKAAEWFGDSEPGVQAQAKELLELGQKRLDEALGRLSSPDALAPALEREKAGWNLYYDLLERLGRELANNDPAAQKMAIRAREVTRDCQVL